MSRDHKCGTYGAARRHQRRNEPLDAACKDALKEYQREAQAKRRALLANEPATIAIAPAGIETPPGWSEWQPPDRTVTLHEVAGTKDEDANDIVAWERDITTSWPSTVINDLTEEWLAGKEGVGDRLAALPTAERKIILQKVGHGARTIPNLDRSWKGVTTSKTVTERHNGNQPPKKTKGDAEAAPWPTTVGPWRPITVERRDHRGNVLSDGQVVTLGDTLLQVAPRRVVRAKPGESLPEELEQWDETADSPLLRNAPIRFKTEAAAQKAAEQARHSEQTTTVLVRRAKNRVEIYRGARGSAQSLGQFTKDQWETMWNHRDAQREDPAAFSWLPTEPKWWVFVASKPGWDGLDGVEPVLDTPENRKTLKEVVFDD